jgi:hypothetical protein
MRMANHIAAFARCEAAVMLSRNKLIAFLGCWVRLQAYWTRHARPSAFSRAIGWSNHLRQGGGAGRLSFFGQEAWPINNAQRKQTTKSASRGSSLMKYDSTNRPHTLRSGVKCDAAARCNLKAWSAGDRPPLSAALDLSRTNNACFVMRGCP